jgi:hypothetical protein
MKFTVFFTHYGYQHSSVTIDAQDEDEACEKVMDFDFDVSTMKDGDWEFNDVEIEKVEAEKNPSAIPNC